MLAKVEKKPADGRAAISELLPASRLLKNDSSHRRRPVTRKPRLSKINEFLDAGLRRHDENGWINEFFNSQLG
jgi:hypothetical protein